MNLKPFSDVIDAMQKVADMAGRIASIPKTKRLKLQEAVREAFTLLNSAVNIVYHRLTDATLKDGDADFRLDIRSLSNVSEWQGLERQMRMCEALRLSHRELDSLSMTAPDLVLGSRDWKNIRVLVDEVLEREGELADYIARALERLADQAESSKSPEDIKKLRAAVKRAARQLSKDRRRLMEAELNFLDAIS